MGEPCTSVIIPAFNAASTLKRAIGSALAQASEPLEVIVVDDGSTDETVNMAGEFGDRIKFLRQANAGPAAARNYGIRVALGDFVAFLDADDYWEQGFLCACQNFLHSRSEAVAVSTGLRFRQPDGRDILGPKYLAAHQAESEPFVIEDFFAFWADQDHIRMGSCVIRRDCLIQAGLLNPSLRMAEDLELWALLATHGKWGFIPKILWVGDSDVVAARDGWLKKYSPRWKNCPSMAEWTRRIAPRLTSCDLRGFQKASGRVGMTFARNNVLAGHFRQAHHLAKQYSCFFPNSLTGKLFQVGSLLGFYPFVLFSLPIIGREYQKAISLNLRNVLQKRV